ncbi:hypothetical protein [Streptomyces triculaminicus]|uniref:hypothetical protein n=1 Tax=Streptomyces triculaminicus TaxID=2816232 RepID=UPI0037D6E4C7
MSEQPVEEILAAFGERIRAAITVAMEITEVVARRRMELAREAQASSEAARADFAARLRTERDGAMPIMRQPWDAAWWRRAEPQEIAHVWQVTAGWATTDDPYARTTQDHMRRQIQQRYGVSVPNQPVPENDLALLMTPRPEAERGGSGPGNEPELAEGAQGQYEYVVRDAANPDVVLAQGTLAADPAAAPADVAVQGLRQYAQGGPDHGATRDERIDRLFDTAYGRVSPAGDLSTVDIDVYPAGQGESGRSTPLYSLEGARIEEVRQERRTERQRVIDGQTEASDEEVLAATALEERATREDLRYEQARAAAAGREPGQQVTWSINQRVFEKEQDLTRGVAEGTAVIPPGMSPELFATEQLAQAAADGQAGRGEDYSIVVRDRGSTTLAQLTGAQVEAVRAAQGPAYEAARAAEAGVDVRAVEQAQAELATTTAAARERMGDLRLRREMAEARLRGESDQTVMWAERLRHDLDTGWWETANPTEITGVWKHVGTWPEGAGKTAAQAQLWAAVQRMHGVVVTPGASASDVAAALEKALDAQGRGLPGDRQDERQRQQSRDEEAAANASGERAEGMAAAGEPMEDVRAEAGHAGDMQAAAVQDRQAAAALADVGDREAADAVAVAAQGFSGTPSSRLAASQGKRSQRPRPKPRQQRDQERGRGGR